MGIRTKLIAVSMTLFVVAVGAAGVMLEEALSRFLSERLESELWRQARGFSESLVAVPAAQLGEHTRRVGAAAGIRLTVIDDDGVVLADSDVPDADLATLESHRGRPEVVAALATGRGVDRRTSSTISLPLLYVAVRHRGAAHAPPTVVRAAMPMSEAHGLIRQLRVALLLSMGAALLATLFMTGFASSLFARRVRELARQVRRLDSGDGARAPESPDELADLLGSFQHVEHELQRSMRSLVKARDSFEVVVEAMEEGILALNKRRRVIVANPAAWRMLRLDDQLADKLDDKLADNAELADRPVSELIAIEELRALVEQGYEQEQPASCEFRLPWPPSTTVNARFVPLRASRGAILVLRDVTEVRRVEKVRRDFVANVSHELRTPVSVLRAGAEALLNEDDADQTLRLGLMRSAERLARLVTDLLDLAKIESGSFSPKLEPVPIADAVGRAADVVEVRLSERRHEVRLDLDEGVTANADPGALDQILINLVDNASKYTPEGGHIDIRARRHGGRVRVEVADDGPGIPEQHRARLFERFYRVDPGRSKDMGGTGLGLAIVKHLADAMAGRVGMEPNEPKGAVFWVELPAAEPVDTAVT